ncbi:MAG: CCA tRNA nucleotidyltransferase [Rhizomicrobium sp.]
MSSAETGRLLAALKGDVRFVGGCVRNALLGVAVDDIDLATPLLPNEVMARLSADGISVIATGIAHGTVTAVVGAQHYEITTLRRDDSTDGRHAHVSFSTDWALDAARRDFTMNALYADAAGIVYDYHEGLADLKAGRIRFIGEPRARIREDYLRILRLFRFYAHYGRSELERSALDAVMLEREGLERLSGERIAKEMFRLLEAPDPLPALRLMGACQILALILPGPLNFARAERLVASDNDCFFVPDPVLRLAALLDAEAPRVEALAQRWRLSNNVKARLEDLAGGREKIVSYLSIREMRKLLYRLGKARFIDRVRLRWAEDGKPSNQVAWRALLEMARSWERPVFPLTGRDVMAAGIPEGPQIGKVLAEVEEWWIDADFIEDPFSLAERLKAVAQAL